MGLPRLLVLILPRPASPRLSWNVVPIPCLPAGRAPAASHHGNLIDIGSHYTGTRDLVVCVANHAKYAATCKMGTAREFRRSCDHSGLYPFCPDHEFTTEHLRRVPLGTHNIGTHNIGTRRSETTAVFCAPERTLIPAIPTISLSRLHKLPCDRKICTALRMRSYEANDSITYLLTRGS